MLLSIELICLFVGLTLIDFRERLAEVHDEYEDRERRWNRIASLLDRDDIMIITNLSPGNQHKIRIRIKFFIELRSNESFERHNNGIN